MPDPLDFGYLVEGIVERDPLTDKITIRTTGPDGKLLDFDPSKALETYVGREVRFTLASFETLERLADMVGTVDAIHGVTGIRVGERPPGT